MTPKSYKIAAWVWFCIVSFVYGVSATSTAIAGVSAMIVTYILLIALQTSTAFIALKTKKPFFPIGLAIILFPVFIQLFSMVAERKLHGLINVSVSEFTHLLLPTILMAGVVYTEFFLFRKSIQSA